MSKLAKSKAYGKKAAGMSKPKASMKVMKKASKASCMTKSGKK